MAIQPWRGAEDWLVGHRHIFLLFDGRMTLPQNSCLSTFATARSAPTSGRCQNPDFRLWAFHPFPSLAPAPRRQPNTFTLPELSTYTRGLVTQGVWACGCLAGQRVEPANPPQFVSLTKCVWGISPWCAAQTILHPLPDPSGCFPV